jgi:[NiFe] hydrogenase assembly HybE family chaperone
VSSPRELVERFRFIHKERMQGLPIVHPDLEVEAVGFTPWEEHELGVLIAPWFMNLVLLPCSTQYDSRSQGEEVEFRFPSGPCDFAVNKDEIVGTYLSAVLFRTVINFPSQSFARDVACEALKSLLALPPVDAPKISRRDVLKGRRPS